MTTPTLTCPHCYSRIDLLQALAEDDARELAVILAGFGEHRGVVMAYLELFRPAPDSVMRVATLLKLAREVNGLWQRQAFQFGREAYHLERAQIVEALHEAVKAQPSALKNHNYLKQIMRSKLTGLERQERRQDARAEAGREQQRRERRQPGPALTHPKSEDELQAAADRAAAEARAQGELPIHEQPLEVQAYALATYLRSPLLRHNGPFAAELRGNLARAGVDLDELERLARERPPQLEDGPRLLAACRRQPGGLTPVGDCLPQLTGGDDEGA